MLNRCGTVNAILEFIISHVAIFVKNMLLKDYCYIDNGYPVHCFSKITVSLVYAIGRLRFCWDKLLEDYFIPGYLCFDNLFQILHRLTAVK